MSSRDTRLTMLFYLKQMYAYFLWQRFSPPSVKIIIVGLGSCCHYILYQLFSCFFPSKIMIFVWFKWLYRCMLSSFRHCALFFISQDIVHFLFSQTYDKSKMVNGPCLKRPTPFSRRASSKLPWKHLCSPTTWDGRPGNFWKFKT